MFSSSDPKHAPWFVLVILLVSTLDLTTSLLPATADILWPIPPKPIWLFGIQAMGMLVLLWIGFSWRRVFLNAFRNLPIPRPAAFVLVAWCATACLHVALRQESFPFSPVAMFSSGVPEPEDGFLSHEGYLEVQDDGRLVPVGFLLESSSLFGPHAMPWDYKTGWVFHIYAFGYSRIRDAMLRDLNPDQSRRFLRSQFVYTRERGEVVSPRLKQGTP